MIDPDKISRHYQNLPEDLKVALNDVDVLAKIQKVGKRRGIHINKMDTLLAEVRLFILGINRPNQFAKDLKENLDLSTEQTTTLVEELNNEIFSPIRESLQKIHRNQLSVNSDRDLFTETRTETKVPDFISIGQKKLQQTHTTEQKVTDYSVGKKHDPYQEPI